MNVVSYTIINTLIKHKNLICGPKTIVLIKNIFM